MAKKKAVAKKAVGRKAIPYALIAKLVQGGADALTIAKKIGRINEGGDKTHTVRAIISGMRTRGWKDEKGKLQKLKVERVGREKKAKAPATKSGGTKKKAAKKPAPKPAANSSTPLDGKTLAAGGE